MTARSSARGRRAAAWAAVASLLALGGTAAAGDRELKEARSTFDAAVTAGDDAALAKALGHLARSEPPRGALELVGELAKRERRVALAIRDELSRAGDPRIARALGERLPSLREPLARRLLAEALATVPGDEVSRALVRALDDRETPVRAAAARALGARGPGTAAIASGVLRARALHDPSPRVRKAAAVAGERLGAPAPPGFDVAPAALGLPSRFFAQRIAFVVDASADARVSAFLEPAGLSPVAPVPSATIAALGTKARTRMPAPRIVSAYDVATQALGAALVRLSDDQLFSLLAFNERTVAFAPRPIKATARETSDAREWLGGSPLPASDERDALRAIERALDPGDGAAPDEIWVALAGAPSGRTAVRAEAARDLADRAWARDVAISVVLLELEPPGPPVDERARVARLRAASERRAFAESLAGPTGGELLVVSLARPAPEAAAPAPAGRASDPRTAPIPLTAGRVAARDLAPLRRRVDEALKARDEPALTGLAGELAAAPDPAAAELAVRVLDEGPLPSKLAALDGFARNASPRVHELLAHELHARTDGASALLVARALAAAPGPTATHALAAEAARREGPDDLVRFLLAGLAGRPPEELAPIATAVLAASRRAKGGLAALEARRALAIARGLPPEARPAVAEDRLLPDRFAASGVAFLVDSEEAMDRPFEPPAPGAAAPAPASGLKDPRRAAPPSPPALPASRRTVVARETVRALEALAAEKASANVILLAEGGRAWRTRAAPLAKGGATEARAFLDELRPTPDRQVLRPLERAFEDPAIEEVWVLAAGLPTRSDADRESAAVVARVRELALRRAVHVHVVLVLGSVPADDTLARAARADEVSRLEAFWRPVARATGGTLVLRERVREERPATPPPTRRGGIAGVGTPTTPRR